MAKGVRINKVKTGSQKCFQKLQRRKKKHRKSLNKERKSVLVSEVEKAIDIKSLSTRQKKMLKKQQQRKEKDKTKMEVLSNERLETATNKTSKSKHVDEDNSIRMEE